MKEKREVSKSTSTGGHNPLNVLFDSIAHNAVDASGTNVMNASMPASIQRRRHSSLNNDNSAVQHIHIHSDAQGRDKKPCVKMGIENAAH